MFKMIEHNTQDGVKLFRMEEASDGPSESDDDNAQAPSEKESQASDKEIWSRYDDQSSNSSHSDDECTTHSEHEPWGGSQWSSDAADNEYLQTNERMGFMCERMAPMREFSDDDSISSYDTAPDLLSVSSSDTEDDDANLSDRESIAESENILRLDFGEYLRSMKVTKEGVTPTLEPKVEKAPRTGTRPHRTNEENRCLSAFVEFNGIKAFALFDSGSIADAISPDFARNAKLRIYQLENPVTLQLGTKGSRSKITHGCIAPYKFESKKEHIVSKDYFDIANVDRYDIVIGTVFMRRHGISLHFEDDTIRLRGIPIPTLSEGEEVS
jgi:hypothetical protein